MPISTHWKPKPTRWLPGWRVRSNARDARRSNLNDSREGRKRVDRELHCLSQLFVFETKGEFFCSDCRERAVDATGDLPVGHGANHRQFFRCPLAERTESAEASAEALGHSASELDGLGPALDAAQSLAVARGYGRGFTFLGRG